MMKGKAWTPASLKAVGGTEGIGVTFLEWSGVVSQKIVIDWAIISDEASARRFADGLVEVFARRICHAHNCERSAGHIQWWRGCSARPTTLGEHVGAHG